MPTTATTICRTEGCGDSYSEHEFVSSVGRPCIRRGCPCENFTDEHNEIRLSEREMDRIADLNANPPAPTEALTKAFARRSVARFRVQGDFNGRREATVEIDRNNDLVTVRPKRSKNARYTMPLGRVAEMIMWRILKAELPPERQAAVQARKVKGRRSR